MGVSCSDLALRQLRGSTWAGTLGRLLGRLSPPLPRSLRGHRTQAGLSGGSERQAYPGLAELV